ncbi:hypothetical protein ACFL0M_10805 [Thermodesulfobacteriota bacterium]
MNEKKSLDPVRKTSENGETSVFREESFYKSSPQYTTIWDEDELGVGFTMT